MAWCRLTRYTTLIVTNDFPPRQGGIETFVHAMATRFADNDVVVYTSTEPGAAAYDATLPFPVIRDPSRTLLPTPRVTRRALDVARQHGCDRAWFGATAPLAAMAPAVRAGEGTRPRGGSRSGTSTTTPPSHRRPTAPSGSPLHRPRRLRGRLDRPRHTVAADARRAGSPNAREPAPSCLDGRGGILAGPAHETPHVAPTGDRVAPHLTPEWSRHSATRTSQGPRGAEAAHRRADLRHHASAPPRCRDYRPAQPARHRGFAARWPTRDPPTHPPHDTELAESTARRASARPLRPARTASTDSGARGQPSIRPVRNFRIKSRNSSAENIDGASPIPPSFPSGQPATVQHSDRPGLEESVPHSGFVHQSTSAGVSLR